MGQHHRVLLARSHFHFLAGSESLDAEEEDCGSDGGGGQYHRRVPQASELVRCWSSEWPCFRREFRLGDLEFLAAVGTGHEEGEGEGEGEKEKGEHGTRRWTRWTRSFYMK